MTITEVELSLMPRENILSILKLRKLFYLHMRKRQKKERRKKEDEVGYTILLRQQG